MWVHVDPSSMYRLQQMNNGSVFPKRPPHPDHMAFVLRKADLFDLLEGYI